MNSEITILLADDHPIFRRGLRQLIETDASLKILAEAENGKLALELIEQLAPDVAVLDMDMPLLDGIEVVRAIREKQLAVEFIFLTMHKDEDIFNDALDAGAKGYVLKDSAATDILQSIRAVVAGENFISPQLFTYLLSRSTRVASLIKQKPSLDNLTSTERRILKLIAENKTSREIASELFISLRTVENHRANICLKLDLRGAHALLRFALHNKAAL